MAGLRPEPSEQLWAIAGLRWRLVVNSLRSIRGRLNLVSRAFGGLLVLATGLIGGSVLFLIATWATAADHRNLQWLAIPFWVVFLFWQFFPVMATAFTQNLDASSLLRFPMRYSTYFLVRVIYGTLDIATGLCVLWLAGLFLGISFADPKLAPWALLTIGLFALFNILLARMIFAWLDHWLSRRRSREILGVLFLFVMIGFQMIGPLLGRYNGRLAPQFLHVLVRLLPVEQAFPPGLAASSLIDAAQGKAFAALVPLALLTACASAAAGLLHLGLRSQYLGENITEGEKRQAQHEKSAIRRGWKIPWMSGQISAIFEKELRYLSRSGPMLFTLIMPMVVVFVLWGGRRGVLGQQGTYAFPVGAAYCLLVMTNMVYNNLGGDGGGIQFFMFSPVSFRQIFVAKNMAHMAIVAAQVFLLWMGVRVIYHPPALAVVALTLAWYLFAAPINFTVGNLLSIYSPKRIDYATFGRQRASEATIFASLGVQLAIVGSGALVVFLALHFANLWVGAMTLLALSVPSIAGYLLLLSRIDRLVNKRREVLATELCRT